MKLDKEKHKAEEYFKEILEHWQLVNLHQPPHPHKHHCGMRWKRLNKWIKSVFGVTTRDGQELDGHMHRPPHKLIKAVKRIQTINRKLSGFESGFISEEGITEREWYKHLVVAPGKWLGCVSLTFTQTALLTDNFL